MSRCLLQVHREQAGMVANVLDEEALLAVEEDMMERLRMPEEQTVSEQKPAA